MQGSYRFWKLVQVFSRTLKSGFVIMAMEVMEIYVLAVNKIK
jgi:hypothetical protein